MKFKSYLDEEIAISSQEGHKACKLVVESVSLYSFSAQFSFFHSFLAWIFFADCGVTNRNEPIWISCLNLLLHQWLGSLIIENCWLNVGFTYPTDNVKASGLKLLGNGFCVLESMHQHVLFPNWWDDLARRNRSDDRDIGRLSVWGVECPSRGECWFGRSSEGHLSLFHWSTNSVRVA